MNTLVREITSIHLVVTTMYFKKMYVTYMVIYKSLHILFEYI